jgi:hypothetical protein
VTSCKVASCKVASCKVASCTGIAHVPRDFAQHATVGEAVAKSAKSGESVFTSTDVLLYRPVQTVALRLNRKKGSRPLVCPTLLLHGLISTTIS